MFLNCHAAPGIGQLTDGQWRRATYRKKLFSVHVTNMWHILNISVYLPGWNRLVHFDKGILYHLQMYSSSNLPAHYIQVGGLNNYTMIDSDTYWHLQNLSKELPNGIFSMAESLPRCRGLSREKVKLALTLALNGIFCCVKVVLHVQEPLPQDTHRNLYMYSLVTLRYSHTSTIRKNSFISNYSSVVPTTIQDWAYMIRVT